MFLYLPSIVKTLGWFQYFMIALMVGSLTSFRNGWLRMSSEIPSVLKAGLYNEIFLSRPWNFYSERKVSKYFRKQNVCCEILFSLFTQSSFIHTIIITFHSQRELTVFIFLVMDIAVFNHVWKYWKSAHNYVVSDWGKIRWRRWTS